MPDFSSRLETNWVVLIIRIVQLSGMLPLRLISHGERKKKVDLKQFGQTDQEDDQRRREDIRNDSGIILKKLRILEKKNILSAASTKRNSVFNKKTNRETPIKQKRDRSELTILHFPRRRYIVINSALIPWCIISRIVYVYSIISYFINISNQSVPMTNIQYLFSILLTFIIILYSFGSLCAPLKLTSYVDLFNNLLLQKPYVQSNPSNPVFNLTTKLYIVTIIVSFVASAFSFIMTMSLMTIYQYWSFYISLLIILLLFRGCCVSLYNMVDCVHHSLREDPVKVIKLQHTIFKVSYVNVG